MVKLANSGKKRINTIKSLGQNQGIERIDEINMYSFCSQISSFLNACLSFRPVKKGTIVRQCVHACVCVCACACN